MAAGSPSRKLSASARRELDVAAAVAREAVLQLHVDRALGLIRLVEARVSLTRALDIYLRLHTLTGSTADMISNRVLASFGRDAGGRTLPGPAATAQPTAHEPSDEDEDADERSLFRSVRRRLRGRVNDELRREVELHMGVTRVALINLHVRHAHGFVRMLGDAHDIAAACAIYAELIGIPATLAPVLYVLVLDSVAADEKDRKLPPGWRQGVQPAPRDVPRRRKVLDVM